MLTMIMRTVTMTETMMTMTTTETETMMVHEFMNSCMHACTHKHNSQTTTNTKPQ